MKKSKISTAAFLAGVTTLAVSLPVLAEQRSYDTQGFGDIFVSDGLVVDTSPNAEHANTVQTASDRTLRRPGARERIDGDTKASS